MREGERGGWERDERRMRKMTDRESYFRAVEIPTFHLVLRSLGASLPSTRYPQ